METQRIIVRLNQVDQERLARLVKALESTQSEAVRRAIRAAHDQVCLPKEGTKP